ncbi:Vacuolar membrane-associated protein IML1 [Candida viswanathii]|uniref:Vacuolar membrane-associated protein IML1 n=1 Tax=Candida viswanathii TaxID=5486 RepID=A0A367Y3P5_9ASCO|nr:Vacuolar membrane-associated protein IML1 [Candida viswanathii]
MQHPRMFNSGPNKGPSSNMPNTNMRTVPARKQMSANHASLTIGAPRTIPNQPLRSTLNRNVGSTLIVSRTKNHFLDKPNESRAGLTKVVSNTQNEDMKTPVQLTVWFHDLRDSSEDVMIDANAIPGGVQLGQVFELQSLEEGASRKLVFIVNRHNLRKELDDSETIEGSKSKFQISLMTTPLQKLLDLPPRSQVQLKRVTKVESVTLDLVEIFIKDVNLSRDGMWNFSASLVDTCTYTDQRLLYLGNRVGTVKNTYKNGKNVFSGYIGKDTKIIYRSESAKLTVFIQLSREMWHFEEDGEIMFHKLVNNLFPEIFRRWRQRNTHHSITIVLFTSIDLTDIPWTNLGPGERPPQRRDFFRVVVDQVNNMHWDKIMADLRLEFANFKRDTMLNLDDDGKFIIENGTLPAIKGNLLEAVNLGLTSINDRFRNTDLKHSLNHIMIITPGTGLFDVDYDLLLETSRKISSIDTSLDIICLSQQPLHVTPLFRYFRDGKVCHCVPIWCDISFYQDKLGQGYQWIPRCKIYELQMMGVMENEASDAKIPRFHPNVHDKSLLEVMDSYDSNVFKPVKHVQPQVHFPEQPHKPRLDFKLGEPKREKPKFQAPEVKNANVTLSLMMSNKPILQPSNGSTISMASGTVVHPVKDVSALSSLYHINKNSDDIKSPAPSVRSETPISTIRTIETFRKSAGSPRIIKGESLFTKKEESKHARPSVPNDMKVRKKSSILIEPEMDIATGQFWIEISNPSRDTTTNVLQRTQVSRWSNIFPDKIQRKLIKWRSFQAPAALPTVTGVFPSKKQLETDYKFQIYTVFLNPDNYWELESTHALMREMIQLRLMLGFQICYGEKVNRAEAERKPSGSVESIIKYFPTEDNYLGARIYLSLEDEIHRIFCDYNGNINVQLYRKMVPEESKIRLGQPKLKPYFPLIRTRYTDEYTPARIDAISDKPQKYNWNQFDQLLAGFDDAMPEDKKEFHKMKFVVMPTDIPKNAYFISNENLNPEEIRVEGLLKLIRAIDNGAYKPPEKKKKRIRRESEVMFYTGNLYDFLNEEAQNYDITGTQPALMIPESSRFNKTIKLSELACELQNRVTGLTLVDRNWHFKKHLYCFVGSELVSWLVDSFEDIETRDDAITYGQNLMNKGLFRHVEQRHGLLDGHYFYEFEDEYADKSDRGKPTWFGTKKFEGVTSPKLNTSPRIQADLASSLNVTSEASSMADSTGRRRKKFILSRAVKFDVDPLGKSFRPEFITVHYDRVHNPEHCYHICLQWLNTTNKFIEDTIVAWSRLCERHGLKLVETPWKELCMLPKLSPFHSFVEVKLSLNPWTDPELCDDEMFSINKYFYHSYFLKKLGYYLDNRSTSFFLRENIDIGYSWGAPSFRYAQFIHRTGFYIAELRDNGDFFLAPNNMHLARVGSSATPSGDFESNAKAVHTDSHKIMLTFRAACQNVEFLREIFTTAKSHWKDESFPLIA